MIVSKQLYDLVVESRPFKLGRDEVDYREADGEEQCKNCIHFYERRWDKFGVCEIFRDDETDEKGVNEDWVCSFHTVDGKEFPLLSE